MRRFSTILAVLGAGGGLALAAWQVYRADSSNKPPSSAVSLEEWLEEGPLPSEVSPEVLALRQEARGVVRGLLERFPQRPESFDVVGLWHLRSGRVDLAGRCWQHALELDPTFGHAYRALGQLARDRGDYALAAELLRKAAAADPSAAADISVELADVLVKGGNLAEAQQVAEQSLADDPAFVPSLYQLASILMERREYARAREVLERAVAVGPNFGPAYVMLINACSRLGDTVSARAYREIFEGLRAKEKQSAPRPQAADEHAEVRQVVAEICTAAARVYVAFGDRGTGESLLRRAWTLSPQYLVAPQALAWLYQEESRWDEALELLHDLYRANPDDLQTCVALGALCLRLGRFDEAEKACKAALALAPGRAEAHAALADVYLRSGRNLAEARKAAARAVELRPTAPFYYLLSLACEKTGDRSAARSAIREALRREPSNSHFLRLQQALDQP